MDFSQSGLQRPSKDGDDARPVAILLCAGYGTRMGALTEATPKPLLEVAGRPMLDRLLEQAFGLRWIRAVHVVTNHRYADAFEQWAEGHRPDLEAYQAIHVHDDGSTSADDRLGAIGDLRFVLERVGRPVGALVAAGDNILRFSLAPLWRQFRRGLVEGGGEAPSVVLALEETDPAALRRTGVLELDGDRVVRLHEKPSDPQSNWACPSCYALSSAALGSVGPYLDSGRPHDEIGRFVAHLVSTTEVRAVRTHGERLHVGHPEELERADRILRATEDQGAADGESNG